MERKNITITTLRRFNLTNHWESFMIFRISFNLKFQLNRNHGNRLIIVLQIFQEYLVRVHLLWIAPNIALFNWSFNDLSFIVLQYTCNVPRVCLRISILQRLSHEFHLIQIYYFHLVYYYPTIVLWLEQPYLEKWNGMKLFLLLFDIVFESIRFNAIGMRIS